MNTHRKTKIAVTLEKKDGLLWGIVEGKGNFVPTPYGKTTADVIISLKELISGYQKNEGKKDAFWSKVDINNMNVEFSYDLQAFFAEFDDLKSTGIARRAGINESLLRQYASGSKYPSEEQVKKIEDAIHMLAKRLQQVSIYA